MYSIKKVLLSAVAVSFVLASSYSGAQADTANVHASLNTRQAIALTKNSDMVFGTVEFTAVHTGTIQLGTNGSVGLGAGSSGLALSGTTSAGDVEVTAGNGASIVNISCSSSGTLVDSGTGSGTLSLINAEVRVDTGVAFGSGISCLGAGTAVTTASLASGASPNILVGAEIDVSSNAISASSAFTTVGGTPIIVEIVYQ